MKTTFLNLLFFALASTFIIISCKDDESDTPEEEVLLVEHSAVTMGWGKGKLNNDGYLSLSMGDGTIDTFFEIADNDEATQGLVDIVFSGDWGNAGGGISICAPNEGGAAGATYEYTTNWIRKKGTQLTEVNLDAGGFDGIKTVPQILALESENEIFYAGWAMPAGTGQGKTYLIRTYEGYLALIFLQSVMGTYADENAKVTLRIKVTPTTF